MYLYAGEAIYFAGEDYPRAEQYRRTGLKHTGVVAIEHPIRAKAVLVRLLRAQGKEEEANKQGVHSSFSKLAH